MQLASGHDDATSPARALLDMLLEGVGGSTTGKRLGQGEADIARRFDEKARRKVLGDGLRVKAANLLKGSASQHGV